MRLEGMYSSIVFVALKAALIVLIVAFGLTLIVLKAGRKNVEASE